MISVINGDIRVRHISHIYLVTFIAKSVIGMLNSCYMMGPWTFSQFFNFLSNYFVLYIQVN